MKLWHLCFMCYFKDGYSFLIAPWRSDVNVCRCTPWFIRLFLLHFVTFCFYWYTNSETFRKGSKHFCSILRFLWIFMLSKMHIKARSLTQQMYAVGISLPLAVYFRWHSPPFCYFQNGYGKQQQQPLNYLRAEISTSSYPNSILVANGTNINKLGAVTSPFARV